MSLGSEERGKSFLNLLLEVVPVTVGVFLALWANNWHEDREHRAQAQAALRNFVGEMETNLQATQRYRPYHEALAGELVQFLRSKEPPSEDRFSKEVHFEGVRPVIYEHTAWDLALARPGHTSLILSQTGFSLRHFESLHPAECLPDLGKQLPRFCIHAGEHVERQCERFGHRHGDLPR